MLKITTPTPFATIPATYCGDIVDADRYDSTDLGARLPTVIAGAVVGSDGMITAANLYQITAVAGRRMRALAVEFGHWWACCADNGQYGITPHWEHWTASNSACWTVDLTSGAVLAEVRLRDASREDAPVIIIEAPAGGAVRIHIAGYPSVWTPSGWDHGTKPAAAGVWDAAAAAYAWGVAKIIIKALGAPATLPGDSPLLA